MIKAIIFDCFGVLTVDLWKEFVAKLPDDQKQQARDINHAYDAGFITNEQFRTQIKDLTGQAVGEVESIFADEGPKNRELLNYIVALKPTYKIGILSNIASNWINEVLLTNEEQRLFDDMVLSFQVRVTKPEPRIFELACERLGVQPAEVVMVDDIEANCQAAQGIGMKSIVYHDFPQLKADLEQLLHHT